MTLEEAIALAARAHTGQTDKAGAPYILHPLRVMLAVASEEERLVAVLHDVLEDTALTAAALRAAGLPERCLTAIEALTRQPTESYEDFIVRAKADGIARNVKLADLRDNMNLDRIPNPTEKDHERLARYRRAWAVLTSAD